MNFSSGFVCSGETYPFQINCSDSLHFDVDTLMCIVPEYPDCVSKLCVDLVVCIVKTFAQLFIVEHESYNNWGSINYH